MSAFLQQPSAPPAPSSPPAPGTPGAPFIVRGSELPGRELTRQDVDALRARSSELRSQLDRATRQRREISEQLRRADGANKAGLERRIIELDNRIIRTEGEIDEVSQQLASTAATRFTVTAPPRTAPPQRNPFDNVDVEPIIITFTLFVLCPIALSISRLIWKRGSVRTQAAPSPESSQRLERMEQAMDAIAIEIERVSEGQRFVTRLLSERGPAAIGVGQHAAEPVRVPLSDASRVR
jgi:hypothetical protein